MKRRLFLFTLVCLALFLSVSVSVAQDVPECGGLLTALEHIPPDSPAYARVLERAQENCGESLDRAALVALYESTNGDDWRYNTNWLATDDHCDGWYGVHCTDGRVDSLDLPYNILGGSLPVELGNLTNLEILDLHDNNNISGPIPAALGNLTNLEILDLTGNNFSGPIPTTLGNLTELSSLNLGDNNLSGPIPAALGNLTNLEHLTLFYNDLSGPLPVELGNLIELRGLYLYFNNISGPIPATLGDLANLEILHLTGNPLTCWETEDLLAWAVSITGYWDDPPGTTICP